MPELRYSPAAIDDLNKIDAYIQDELKNSAAAHNIVSAILDAVEKLKEFPGMGSRLSSVIDIESDYRHLVCGHYIVFYRIDSTFVYIDRILYGGCDYLHVLFGSLPEK